MRDARYAVLLVLWAGAACGVARAAPTSIPISIDGDADIDVPAPRGLEAKLIDDAKDGRLDSVDLATAALIASGVDDKDVPRERDRLLAAIAQAQAQAKTQRSPKKKGERLLLALHDTTLRRYVEQQSRVDTVTATGEFNCSSSAVVFAIAADGIVDAPRGMLSLTHAFVRASVAGKDVDVETTTPHGFAVDRAKLITREYLRARNLGGGLSDEERLRDLQNPQEVSVVGLVAGLYSNRGVQAIHQGDLRSAAIAFSRAQAIATGEQRARVASWRAALLNNAVVGLLNDKRYKDARRLIRIGLDGATGSARDALLTNQASLAVALAEDARAAGRIAEAIAFCDEALATKRLNAKTASQVQALRAELIGQQAGGDLARCLDLKRPAERAACAASVSTDLMKRGAAEDALDAARTASAAADDERAQGTHYNALLGVITQREEKQRCLDVEDAVRELVAVRRRMKNPPAVETQRLMAQCHWRRASALVDKGDYDGASVAFARAAVHLPNDVGLKKNRAEVSLRQAETLARAARCDEARPLVRRAEQLTKKDDRGARLLAFCESEVANRHAKEGRYAEAVAALRRGLKELDDDSLRENLGRMVHNVAVSALKDKRCDDALALLPELDRLKRSIAKDVRSVCSG